MKFELQDGWTVSSVIYMGFAHEIETSVKCQHGEWSEDRRTVDPKSGLVIVIEKCVRTPGCCAIRTRSRLVAEVPKP